jgi:hypothetical protein
MSTKQATTEQAAYIVAKVTKHVNMLEAEACAQSSPHYMQTLRADAAYIFHTLGNFMRSNDLVQLRDELYEQETLPREDVMSVICTEEEHGLTHKFFNELHHTRF